VSQVEQGVIFDFVRFRADTQAMRLRVEAMLTEADMEHRRGLDPTARSKLRTDHQRLRVVEDHGLAESELRTLESLSRTDEGCSEATPKAGFQIHLTSVPVRYEPSTNRSVQLSRVDKTEKSRRRG
jgi:hypothetical protein